MSHGIWKQQGNPYDVTNSEAGWQATNPASCKHDPGLKEVPEPSSKHSISAVAHSGEVAATSGGTGRNHQGEFDSLTARSARSDSCGSVPSALRFISPKYIIVYCPVYLGDDIYCCHPICQLLLDHDTDFIFVCKPSGRALARAHP